MAMDSCKISKKSSLSDKGIQDAKRPCVNPGSEKDIPISHSIKVCKSGLIVTSG